MLLLGKKMKNLAVWEKCPNCGKKFDHKVVDMCVRTLSFILKCKRCRIPFPRKSYLMNAERNPEE